MHPDPLVGVPEEKALEDGVVGLGVAADGLAGILTVDERQGILKAQNVSAVGLPPAYGGNHRGLGAEREQGQAFEGSGRVTEKVHDDSVLGSGILIEDVDHDRALAEEVEDGIQRPSFCQGAEAGAAKPVVDKTVQERGFERSADEMKQTAVLFELTDPRNGGDLEISEMTGQKQDAFSRGMGAEG